MTVEYQGETYATNREAAAALGVSEMTIARAGVRGMLDGRTIRVTKRATAKAAISADLEAKRYTAQQIASRNKVSASYVAQVAGQIGVKPMPEDGTLFQCMLDGENTAWIIEEAKRHDLRTGDILQMLVTDARQE